MLTLKNELEALELLGLVVYGCSCLIVVSAFFSHLASLISSILDTIRQPIIGTGIAIML